MNVARPVKKEEYDAFRKEVYSFKDGVETSCNFTVSMDADPTLQPKNLTANLAEVQAKKDRLVVVLNRAILNESYWRTVAKRIESKYESETSKAFLEQNVRELKNQELRQGQASIMAADAVVRALFDGKGNYDEHMALIYRNLQDAIAFSSEVKNIYENLDHASRNLAVQLKSVMVNARVYGDPSGDEPSETRLVAERR